MAAARTGTWKIQIVRRCDRHKFVVLPKRRIVERIIGWISRIRRLARDFERRCRIAAAFVRMARLRIMLRRLAPKRSAQIHPTGWALRLIHLNISRAGAPAGRSHGVLPRNAAVKP